MEPQPAAAAAAAAATAALSTRKLPHSSPKSKSNNGTLPSPNQRQRGTPRKGKGASATDRGALLASVLSPEDGAWAAQTAQAMCVAAGQTFVEQRQWDHAALVLMDQRLHERANVTNLHLRSVLLFISLEVLMWGAQSSNRTI